MRYKQPIFAAAILAALTASAITATKEYVDRKDGEIAVAATNLVADATNNLTTAVAAVSNETALVYRLYSGSNVVCEVTNYNSAVHAPAMRLLQLDTNGAYKVVWTETNGLARVARASTNYTDAAVAAEHTRADAAYAPRGWSATTSGLGAEAPENTTWISTPTTVIAGGFEFEKVATTAGALWILTSNGMVAQTNQFGFFDLSATDGTSVFRIEKTDSYLVGANADGITSSGNTVTVPVDVVSDEHPYLRYAAGLESPITWYREEDENIPASISYSWSGSSGAWVCTITTAASKGFFAFEFLQQGETKIINNGVTDLSAGIYYNGHKYMPTVNGTKLEFVRQ